MTTGFWDSAELSTVPLMNRRPGAVDLFAFSAAVGMPARIHYDQQYSRDVEGHRDTVVPGPLQASYMCQVVRGWLRSSGRRGSVVSLRYRHHTPVYVDSQLEIGGEVRSVDEEAGRVVLAIWTRVAGEDEMATQGEAVVAIDQ